MKFYYRTFLTGARPKVGTAAWSAYAGSASLSSDSNPPIVKIKCGSSGSTRIFHFKSLKLSCGLLDFAKVWYLITSQPIHCKRSRSKVKVTALRSVRFVGGGRKVGAWLNPHCLRTTPLLVTVKFGLEGRIRTPQRSKIQIRR